MSIYNVDAGFQQKIGKGNSHIGLVLTDIFKTLKVANSSMEAISPTNEFQK